jgi:SAM-dependent methyltransferase
MVCVLTNETRTAVEIGTGWCPTIPLGLTERGISVHTYDHFPYVTEEAIAASQSAVGGDWSRVHYHAPGDATATGLPDNSVDLSFSIAVLEHIPYKTLTEMLREAYRILRPGGIAYHEIDLRDHFAEFDSSISTVNFLKFGDKAWRWLGQNGIHYHNRLRASDFRALFRDFELIAFETRTDERAPEALKRLRIVDRFKDYDLADLAVSVIVVVARKPDTLPLDTSKMTE